MSRSSFKAYSSSAANDRALVREPKNENIVAHIHSLAIRMLSTNPINGRIHSHKLSPNHPLAAPPLEQGRDGAYDPDCH